MARSGVYFSDVKKARDALIAQGRHPSIDAVRAALGDTGSKTTIHKYLREIESEEAGQKSDVSEAILDLVGKLATGLKQEAAREVESMRAQMAGQEALHAHTLESLRGELADAQQALASSHAQYDTMAHELEQMREQLMREQETRRDAELRNRALSERLQDAERHQASLEEKHQQAREALSHFRAASQQQREQELRRHEQQVQGLQVELRQAQLALAQKQEEVTRLNREAAALATDLGAARSQLHDAHETQRVTLQRIDALQEQATRAAILGAQLADAQAAASRAEQALERSMARNEELQRENGAIAAQLDSARQALALALESRLARLDEAILGKHDDKGGDITK